MKSLLAFLATADSPVDSAVVFGLWVLALASPVAAKAFPSTFPTAECSANTYSHLLCALPKTQRWRGRREAFLSAWPSGGETAVTADWRGWVRAGQRSTASAGRRFCSGAISASSHPCLVPPPHPQDLSILTASTVVYTIAKFSWNGSDSISPYKSTD